MRHRVQRIHFVGIGGSGMSGIAEILQASGYTVSGSDVRDSAVCERLRSLGIELRIGHDSEAIHGAHVVVYSSAVSPSNPEIEAAHAQAIPVIPRAEMLAELMRMKYGVAIAGSHGKTTTTSLVAAVLQHAGLDPTTIVGGRVKSLGTNSRLGAGDVLVAEADESDGSFLRLVPTVVVITNIDREHMDHYRSFDRLRQAFLDFANRVPFFGCSVLCLDDPEIQRLLPDVTRRTWTYGQSTQADMSADRIELVGLGARFRARIRGTELGEVRLQVPGVHNVTNALAAIAVGLEFDVPFARIREALGEFHGVERRFEVYGEPRGILIVDDYAHHPAEIRATLRAARDSLGRRTIAVFQPHRYTRTRDCFEELATAFHDADVLVLTDVYPAGEPKIEGIDGERLAEAARASGHRAVHYVPNKDELVSAVQAIAETGDVVLFMGAGDIGRLPARMRDALEAGGDR
jgi:UDP-N-acetylmuramate--alanine ligase